MEELKKYLTRLGACRLAGEADSIESALSLMFTPQGREFCIMTGFPTLEFLRRHKEELAALPGVYLDCGCISIQSITPSTPHLLIAGSATVSVNISQPSLLHKIIVAHSASLRLSAGGHAVATVGIVGDAALEVTDDGTAKVTIERLRHEQ